MATISPYYYGGNSAAYTPPKKKPVAPVTTYIGGPGGGPVTGQIVAKPPNPLDDTQSVIAPGLPGGAPLGGGGGGGDTGGGTDPNHPGFNVPGYIPDYESLIKNNWSFQQALKDIAAQHGYAFGQFGDAARSGVVSSGYDLSSYLAKNPALAAALKDILTGETFAAAQANPFSQAALEARQFQQDNQTNKDRLAGVGAANSGQMGYLNSNELFRHNAQDYSNVQNTIAYLAGQQKAYLEGETGRDTATANARNAAAQEEMALHPATGEKQAHWSSADNAYVDADGNVYDPNTHLLIPGRKAGQGGGTTTTTSTTPNLPYTPPPVVPYTNLVTGETLDPSRIPRQGVAWAV